MTRYVFNPLEGEFNVCLFPDKEYITIEIGLGSEYENTSFYQHECIIGEETILPDMLNTNLNENYLFIKIPDVMEGYKVELDIIKSSGIEMGMSVSRHENISGVIKSVYQTSSIVSAAKIENISIILKKVRK